MPNFAGDMTGPLLDWDASGFHGVVWDRDLEAREISLLLAPNRGRSRSVTIYPLQDEPLQRLAGLVAGSLGRKLYTVATIYDPPALWAAIFGIYVNETKRVPINLASHVLKYTTQAGMMRQTRSAPLRSVSNYIHAQRRARAPTTLRRAIERFRLTPEQDSPVLDALLDQNWSDAKGGRGVYARAFRADLAEVSQLQTFVEESLFLVRLWSINKDVVGRFGEELIGSSGIKMLFAPTRAYIPRTPRPFDREDQYGEFVASYLNEEEAKSLLSRAAVAASIHPDEGVLAGVLAGSGLQLYGQGASRRLYTELELSKAATAIAQSAITDITDLDIRPQSAPLDAEVRGGMLRVVTETDLKSGTGFEALDALRQSHESDVSDLLDKLRGSNVSPGFNRRLERAQGHLGKPLTQVSALLLATEARALETMFPAVAESLTDVSAADIGATVSGLGLYVRQFTAWREYLAEAQKADLLTSGSDSLAGTAGAALEGAGDLVDAQLVAGLQEIREAATDSKDSVVELGYLRAVNNAYRAVGRYLRDRATGSAKEFNKALDEGFGKGAADAAFALLITSVAVPLISLAGAVPNEFGWAIPLLAFLAARLRR